MAESQRVRATRKDPLYPNSIGYCIKKYGYTRSELAAEIGIDRKTLYFYCTGQLATPKYTLEKIARTLGCSIEELRSLRQTMKSESTAIASASLPEVVYDTMEAVEGQIVSLQEWQAAPNQEQEDFDMDNGRRDLLQQFLGAVASIALLENKEALLSLLQSLPFQSAEISSKPLAAISIEEFLPQCAASIKSCWYLMQGRAFGVIEEVLSAYFPTLADLVEQSTEQRKAAASLLTQGYRLKGIAALHYNNLEARAACCRQAVRFGEIAEDTNLQVASLKGLADTFYYSHHPTSALQTYQKASSFFEQVSPLLRSRVCAGLGVAFAECGQEQEALRHINLAFEHFPQHPESDESFLYADFSLAELILWEGLVYLALSSYFPNRLYARKSWGTFAKIEESQPISERVHVEIINHQADTALALGELELFCSYMQQGIKGAKRLNSQQRRQEAITIYKNARYNIWPHEPRVRELADLFL